MSIIVRKNLVSSSKYSLKCPYSMTAQYITVHNTYNDASADAEVRYCISNSNSTSFHFAVDDKEVVQAVPVNRNAWHTGDSGGDGNRKSIGVEICYSLSGGERYRKAEALAAKFIAQLLKERGWGIDRVKTHKHWTEIGVRTGRSSYVKNCPHRILTEGRWQQFLNAVQAELNGSVAQKQPVPPRTNQSVSQTPLGEVKVVVDDLNVRNAPNADAYIIGKAKNDTVYSYFAYQNDWYDLGNGQWCFANGGKYIQKISDTQSHLAGKRVESKVNNLNFRNKPSWNNADVVGVVNVGQGFIIDEKIMVDGSPQYKVHNSKGQTFYITANEEYVRVE